MPSAPPPLSRPDPPVSTERAIVFLVGAVQFVNILDFVMVMPLGPDFATALGIPTSRLGYIGGSYTAAAAISGLLGSIFLDKLDRRQALAGAMFGLVCGTAAGGFAHSFAELLAARVIAGAFGGPATSIAFSIIADAVPSERRGKAMGAVMGAFSIASVLGVPAGLELARQGGWRLPFLAVAGLGLVVSACAVVLLPPMRGHLLYATRQKLSLLELVARPTVRLSYAMTAVVMMAGFILIPNLSAFIQGNLGYPRSRLGLLYLTGGVCSFFAMRLAGRAVDRWGSFRVGCAGTAGLLALLYFGFVRASLHPLAIFIGFMVAMAFRNVSYNTLTSKVPLPDERARFQSIQSSVQHLASAMGAFLSSKILVELPDHRLAGIDTVALISMALTASIPAMLFVVERRVRPH